MPKIFCCIPWKKLNTDGVRNVLQKQNKKLFSCQKFQHTNEDDNTNVHSAEKNHGCKVEDRLQNQFIDQNCDQKYYFLKKACVELHQLV